MLVPMTEKEKTLTIKNIVNAVKDIHKLNKRGYNFLYLASGFIAHYNINGFIDHYRYTSLRNDILTHKNMNIWDNFHIGEEDYEYYHQKGEIYQEICRIISSDQYNNIPLDAHFCDNCHQAID